MEDATSLDALLPSPQGPQSASPMIPMPSGGGGGYSPPAPSFRPTLPAAKFMLANTTLYLAIFAAAVIISLSTPRNLILQYVPNAYTSSGVVSWQGAAVLGGAAVILVNVIRSLLAGFLG